MGAMYIRGGIPIGIRKTVDQVGAKYVFPKGVSNFVVWYNHSGTIALRVYFTEEDFTAGTNYALIPATVGTPGNPLEIPAELGEFWAAADTTGSVEFTAIAMIRRG